VTLCHISNKKAANKYREEWINNKKKGATYAYSTLDITRWTFASRKEGRLMLIFEKDIL